jgi:hypothetical protein
MSLLELSRLLELKSEPQTTFSLSQSIEKANAVACVSDYHVTPALREHFKKAFECVVHRKGQGYWVQAEYGAGKTHFLGVLINLLMWREEGVWNELRDSELKKDYEGPLSKIRMFPVAFSLRGLGDTEGKDSLMRILEEQIRESLNQHDPELSKQVKLTSAELADAWYTNDASSVLRPAVAAFFQEEHHCSPDEFRAKQGPKKFGQQLVRSTIPEGRLQGKFKDRFSFIYDQITKLGKYDGLIFIIDEFRSWQDRHTEGSAAYAEDEEILETLAYVLPTQHLNIVTVVASQGDMPQKLSGGGQGDRFVPLYLLADKNKGDFGEIVTFRCRALKPGAGTDIKDYYDYCRKEYRFIKQANISLEYFTATFPFQPRTFDVMRRITQNADKHNLPTARSAIRIAWETLKTEGRLKEKRLITLSDIIRTTELGKGLNHEFYRDDYQGLQTAIEQLAELGDSPEEQEQTRQILETLFLWAISLPETMRDGLTAQEVAEAAWLMDDALGANAQAELLLTRLVQSGYPVKSTNKTRDGKEVVIYSYERSVAQDNPGKHFAPLKKKAKEDLTAQNAKWVESLFWQLADITKEAQEELGVNGGLLADFAPEDQRSGLEKTAGKTARYQFPKRAAASTKKVHKTQYSGEVVVSDHWRAEFGESIKNADEHFRLVYLTGKPEVIDDKITAALTDGRVAVCRPESLSEQTREALADLIAAENLKRNSTGPSQNSLRDYADNKRREAIKTVLSCQLHEFRRGKVLTQKGYAIPATEIFKVTTEREADLASRLLEKAYDNPLFSPKDLKKDLTDNDAKKVFGGLFRKEPAKAEKDAVANFGVGLELTVKSHPNDFKPDSSQALQKLRELLGSRTDVPLTEAKAAFCSAPYGLTEAMVTLYVCSLVKGGGYELALNPNNPISLIDQTPLPKNRLTTHALALCEWNAKLDRALLGARIVVSVHKGWNEVLPYARVLDDVLKPTATPDDEPARNIELLVILGKLAAELPKVEMRLSTLAPKLGGSVPKPLNEIVQRFKAIAATASFQEFDATARENYPAPEDFKTAFAQYSNGQQLSDRAFDLSSARDYLSDACAADNTLEFDRKGLLSLLTFDTLLKDPAIIPARLESFDSWKGKYAQAYRKAHRAFYEGLQELENEISGLRPHVRALAKMNSIAELGPPLAATLSADDDLAAIDKRLHVCPDAVEAKVTVSATCPKCRWTPETSAPAAEAAKLKQLVATGLADRFQRFKDATIGTILRKAAEANGRADLKSLMEMIQLSKVDSLATVLTDDLVIFLRKLLYDENLVQEQIALGPIVQAVGAIEEERIDEAVDQFAGLLRKAVKDAKAQHGKGKRVRVFLRLQDTIGDPA